MGGRERTGHGGWWRWRRQSEASRSIFSSLTPDQYSLNQAKAPRFLCLAPSGFSSIAFAVTLVRLPPVFVVSLTLFTSSWQSCCFHLPPPFQCNINNKLIQAKTRFYTLVYKCICCIITADYYLLFLLLEYLQWCGLCDASVSAKWYKEDTWILMASLKSR